MLNADARLLWVNKSTMKNHFKKITEYKIFPEIQKDFFWITFNALK